MDNFVTDVSLLISTDWMMRNFIADVWNAANFLQNDLVNKSYR